MRPKNEPTGEDVTLRIDGELATLTLNRPSKLNAMTSGMRHEIGEHLAIIDRPPGGSRDLGSGGRSSFLRRCRYLGRTKLPPLAGGSVCVPPRTST